MSFGTTAILGNALTAPVETKAASAVVGIGDAGAWASVMGVDFGSIAGPTVSPSSAMSVPAVASAVTLISGALGSLPVKLYRADGAAGRIEAHEHAAFELVHDHANDWTSAGKLRAQLVVDALLRGNGYALVRRDENGEPYELLRLPPEAVTILTDPATGEPWYKIAFASGAETVNHLDVLHIAAPASLDGNSGTAPIARSRDAIALAISLERHAARILSKGARPSGLVNAPTIKNKEDAEHIRASIAAQHSNERTGGVAVTFGGVTFEPLEFKSVDMQFLEQRSLQNYEIAKIFNIPPTMIGELSKATLSNSETMGRQFLTLTLMPWINTIRDAYRRTLIRREDRKVYTIDFVTDGLLQADSAGRAAYYASMRAGGNMTANEVRALENLPWRKDGDTLASPHITTNTAPTPEEAA